MVQLIYIHNNPLSEPWNFVIYPQEYKYSSASFYEEGIDIFGLVTHYDDE
jgi:putative transposase